MFAHSILFVYFAHAIGPTIGAPAPIDLPKFELPRLPGLPEIPSIPEIPGIPSLDGLWPELESSGCDVSKTPTVGDFNNSQILGNWYHLYHSKNELTDKMGSDLYKVSNVRSTIAEDAFYPTSLHVFLCSTNTYFGGFFSHDVCPSANYKINIHPGGIHKLEMPSVVKPVLASLVPRLNFDKIEQRVIALEKEFAVFYSCILPLDDGTCAKNGLYLEIYGRGKQFPMESMEKVKAVVGTTCLNFDNLKQVAQEGDHPFYVPSSEDLWV